jgi:inositol-phosphate transport system substrate-binding protein
MRRGQVSITAIALLIIGLIVGALIGYFLIPRPIEGAEDVQKLIQENQELRQKIQILTEKLKPGEITIKVWTIGPDPPSEYRLKNIEIAADILNTWLDMLGANVTVKVDGQFFVRPVEWGEYKNNFYLAYKAGEAPDIYLTGHEDIGFLAANDYIIPLDSYINEFWDVVYYDVIKTLWEAVKYQGKIWGIPQDTEARPMYFRKDVLKKLGWTDEQIAELPVKIKNGEFTLYDLLALAKEAKDAGLVERGILHRVKEGYDYFQFYLGFGGRLWDADQGKMVFTKSAWQKTLQWFYDAVYEYGVISPNQFSGDWDNDFHLPFTGGEALFLSGGTWHKGEWIQKGLLTESSFDLNIGYALHPAGEPGKSPVTLSHPLVYTITKQAKDRGLADLAFILITMATSPHLNSYHSVQSAHLAILYSQISDSRYVEDPFLKDVAYMLEYTTFIPNHPQWGDYSRIVYNIIRAVESGDLSPTDAYNTLLEEIQTTLGDSVIIEP